MVVYFPHWMPIKRSAINKQNDFLRFFLFPRELFIEINTCGFSLVRILGVHIPAMKTLFEKVIQKE